LAGSRGFAPCEVWGEAPTKEERGKMMFGLGVPELLIILVIGLVLFGPGKLPDVGKALGKSIREFKNANKDEEPKNVTDDAKLIADATVAEKK